MSSFERDKEGNIKVFEFTVHFADTYGATDESATARFTDYASGWDWARYEGHEWEGIDSANTYTINYDYSWVPESEIECI